MRCSAISGVCAVCSNSEELCVETPLSFLLGRRSELSVTILLQRLQNDVRRRDTYITVHADDQSTKPQVTRFNRISKLFSEIVYGS